MRDGRVLERHARTRKGDPDAPLSDAELVDKYRELAAPVLGAGEAEALLDALWRVDVLDDSRRVSPIPQHRDRYRVLKRLYRSLTDRVRSLRSDDDPFTLRAVLSAEPEGAN